MLYLKDADISALGELLGQHFTEGQLNELADVLGHAAQGCDYAAEDYAERADFERKHNGSEEADYTEAQRSYSATSETLGKLCAAIRTGEEEGRINHD